MKIAFFDTHGFEKEVFEILNKKWGYQFTFLEPRLTPQTAKLAKGSNVVCSFANDKLGAETLELLKKEGVQLIALRSAGFNHVDLVKAKEIDLPIVRVPAYSPYAVAEHAVALLLTLNRKIFRAYNRVREGNFSLEGLVGFDLHGKTIGVIGTGKIGSVFCRIMRGFGCQVLAFDPQKNERLVKDFQVSYVSLSELFSQSDVISLHVPLISETKHLINTATINQMKKGVFLINTGRGALIDTKALIQSLKTGHLGAAGLDVYEEEEGIFFNDLSNQVLQDDKLARLLTFPNVVITSHQAFLTREALNNIAETTLKNIQAFKDGKCINQVFQH